MKENMNACYGCSCTTQYNTAALVSYNQTCASLGGFVAYEGVLFCVAVTLTV